VINGNSLVREKAKKTTGENIRTDGDAVRKEGESPLALLAVYPLPEPVDRLDKWLKSSKV